MQNIWGNLREGKRDLVFLCVASILYPGTIINIMGVWKLHLAWIVTEDFCVNMEDENSYVHAYIGLDCYGNALQYHSGDKELYGSALTWTEKWRRKQNA